MKKIAFVGAGCTGKTTLLESLRLEYSGREDTVFIEEAARKFFAGNDLPDHERRTPEVQSRILYMILEGEKRVQKSKPKLVFCDRSVVDPIVYITLGKYRKVADDLFEQAQHWVPTYNKFYILDPADIPHQVDDIRVEDDTVRQGLHQAYLRFFAARAIPFELLGGNLEQRLQIVRGEIGATIELR